MYQLQSREKLPFNPEEGKRLTGEELHRLLPYIKYALTKRYTDKPELYKLIISYLDIREESTYANLVLSGLTLSIQKQFSEKLQHACNGYLTDSIIVNDDGIHHRPLFFKFYPELGEGVVRFTQLDRLNDFNTCINTLKDRFPEAEVLFAECKTDQDQVAKAVNSSKLIISKLKLDVKQMEQRLNECLNELDRVSISGKKSNVEVQHEEKKELFREFENDAEDIDLYRLARC